MVPAGTEGPHRRTNAHVRNQFAVPSKSFEALQMDRLCDAGINKPAIDWLWQGYLARGSLTLLTSLWKAGKTTLLTGLLQRLGSGGDCGTSTAARAGTAASGGA